jgi:hypothetical protein
MKRLMMVWWAAVSIMMISPWVYANSHDEHDEALAFESEPMHDLVRRKKNSKKMCDLIVEGCLKAGYLRVDNNLIIEGNLTVDSIINESSFCILPTGGLDGQALIGVTGSDPIFNFINSSNSSVLFTPGSGALGLKAEMFFGNIARVDKIYGNDGTGAVNGLPFLTISAALTAAQTYNVSSGDPVVVWVFPGVYEETLTIPDNVGVVGISAGSLPANAAGVGGVTIEQVNIGLPTTLVTMGNNSLLENVSLRLTTASNIIALTGISVPTSAILSSINLTLIIGNTSLGSVAVNGINVTGGQSIIDQININIMATSNHSARGILVGANSTVLVNDSSIMVQSSGTGSIIGVETNGAGASATINASTISGTSAGTPADISQGTGTTLTIQASTLKNENANAGGFTTTFSPNTLNWAIYNAGAAADTGNFFLLPGTSSNPLPSVAPGYIVTQKCLAKNLTVAKYAGGGIPAATFTLYKNGVATLLSAVLTGTTASDTTHSVVCNAGEVLTMNMVNNAGSVLRDPSVSVELY